MTTFWRLRSGHAAVNFMAEGTYSLPVESLALNQRASRWVAQDQDAMIPWPATNLNGLAFMALSPTYGFVMFDVCTDAMQY
jgi:hypothetical protein